MQKDFDFQIGEWHVKSDSVLGTIEVASNITETVLHFSKDDNQAINDLIVGLLIVNPGENPQLLMPSEVMKHYNRARTTIRQYYDTGKIPGTVLILDADRSKYGITVVPKFALGFHTPPDKSGDSFQSENNPGSKEAREKRIAARVEREKRILDLAHQKSTEKKSVKRKLVPNSHK